MKSLESKPIVVIGVVIVMTLLAQIPSINHWIDKVTTENTHLVTVVEGFVGVILLVIATWKGKGDQENKPEPYKGGQK